MIFIGTSGFFYNHWRNVFYPSDLSQSKWLQYYSDFFKTIEINSTFYGFPNESSLAKWYKETPKGFLFSLKGSRFITHVKRLHNVEDSLGIFINRTILLKEKLGIILWQFPNNFKFDLDRLGKFLELLSKYQNRYAFEFRNEDWFNDKTYALLEKYKVSLVISNSPSFPRAEIIAADFVYIRFHGGKVLYGSEYSEKELRQWAMKIKDWSRDKDVFIYFNNDAYGYAIKDAKQLIGILKL